MKVCKHANTTVKWLQVAEDPYSITFALYEIWPKRISKSAVQLYIQISFLDQV